MLLLLVSVMIGAYCCWCFVGGWSGFSLHPSLGVATISGMCLNVMIALFRCSPQHEQRFLFNWIHFTVGNVTHITAIATIFTAFEATTLPALFLYLMAAFILFHIVIHAMLQLKRKPAEGEVLIVLLFCSKVSFPLIHCYVWVSLCKSLFLPFNQSYLATSLTTFSHSLFPPSTKTCLSDSHDIPMSDSMQRFHVEIVQHKVRNNRKRGHKHKHLQTESMRDLML